MKNLFLEYVIADIGDLVQDSTSLEDFQEGFEDYVEEIEHALEYLVEEGVFSLEEDKSHPLLDVGVGLGGGAVLGTYLHLSKQKLKKELEESLKHLSKEKKVSKGVLKHAAGFVGAGTHFLANHGVTIAKATLGGAAIYGAGKVVHEAHKTVKDIHRGVQEFKRDVSDKIDQVTQAANKVNRGIDHTVGAVDNAISGVKSGFKNVVGFFSGSSKKSPVPQATAKAQKELENVAKGGTHHEVGISASKAKENIDKLREKAHEAHKAGHLSDEQKHAIDESHAQVTHEFNNTMSHLHKESAQVTGGEKKIKNEQASNLYQKLNEFGDRDVRDVAGQFGKDVLSGVKNVAKNPHLVANDLKTAGKHAVNFAKGVNSGADRLIDMGSRAGSFLARVAKRAR